MNFQSLNAPTNSNIAFTPKPVFPITINTTGLNATQLSSLNLIFTSSSSAQKKAVIAYYSDGVALQTLTVAASGSGKIVQTGYESDINGSALSIQKIEIQAKNGKFT